MQYQSLSDINILYDRAFLSKEEADYFFNYLNTNLKYNSKEESKVMIHGQYHYIPREQSAYGDIGTYYRFAGNKVISRQWTHDNCGKVILAIKKRVEKYTGKFYNFVLINRYKDGNSYIGPHSDDERDLVEGSSIVGVSLGASRIFKFQTRTNNNPIKYFI